MCESKIRKSLTIIKLNKTTKIVNIFNSISTFVLQLICNSNINYIYIILYSILTNKTFYIIQAIFARVRKLDNTFVFIYLNYH